MANINELKNYDFTLREKYWQQFWEDNQIYKYDPASQKEVFSIDTPPPYVSASHLHVGHAMSYTQAEFVVRYKRMMGFNVFYPMGFDDNGLPTERFVEKKYKIDKSHTSKKEFIDLCLQATKEGGETYKKFWQSLGVSVDWSLLYSTINEHCQRTSQRSFIDLFQKGLIEHKEGPVIWCPKCQTALAQSDLDDLEQNTFLNYIDFKFEDGTTAPIATTRPELLPACVALYTNSKDPRFAKYIGKKAKVPIFNYEVPVLSDDNVDPAFGTGLMMVCTFGDGEDIERWKRDSLETRIVFDKAGRLTDKAGDYAGLKINEARKQILEDLKENLVKQDAISNVCNVHERCGTIAEFIVTPQWFINVVDHKADWIKRGDELNWYPKFMKSKFDAWIDGLKWDWCISRQRYYGVPFPVWYCDDCGQIVLPSDDELPVDPTSLAAPKNGCSKCGSKKLRPEHDVMDTWMTSSLTPLINANWQYPSDKNLMAKIYPMSLRVQAFEIIRTWLFYTIVKSHYHTDSLPWNDVMISGWGLDEKGRKISKSLGNFVEPEKIIEKYSADALRYWSAESTLGQNLRYNEEEVKVGKRTITKLWNASKFVISHLEEYQFQDSDNQHLEPADRWILSELQKTIKAYHKNFSVYEYAKAKDAVNSFFWDKFCDNYLEFVKYRLYDENTSEESKAAAKWTLYKALYNILQLFAPIMPFITEEIYQLYFINQDKNISIHLTQLPQVEKGLLINDQELKFSDILLIVQEVRKYKASKNYSIKKELSELIVEMTNDDAKNYTDLLKAVLSFQKITAGKGETTLSPDLKITIKE